MKNTIYLLSALAILAAIVPLAFAEGVQSSRENIANNITNNLNSNTTSNITTNLTLNAKGMGISNETGMAPREGSVLRAGGRSARESKALGGNGSGQKSGIEIGLEPRAGFNLSQRYGSVSKFKINSDINTLLFSQNRYTRTRPTYMPPDNLSTREVYNLTAYPVIMLPNAIP